MDKIVKGLYLRERKIFFSTCNEMDFFGLFMFTYKEIFQHSQDSMLDLFHSSPLLATITVGGFNPLAAAFGLITFFQVTQFIYYGLDKNDPSKA